MRTRGQLRRAAQRIWGISRNRWALHPLRGTCGALMQRVLCGSAGTTNAQDLASYDRDRRAVTQGPFGGRTFMKKLLIAVAAFAWAGESGDGAEKLLHERPPSK